MLKKNIRMKILKERDALSKEERVEKSEQMLKVLLSSDCYKNSKSIMAFINFRSEPEMLKLIKKMLSDKKKVSVPVTYESERKILPSLIDSLENLEEGAYGILSPKEKNFIDPRTIDLVITPGVAFDKRGYRIGYGGGYYDRFFEKYPNSIRIGYAFSLQLVDEALPIEKTDLPLNALITELGFVKFYE